MPYVDAKGIRIYYEIEGNGHPLVLAHGITNNLEVWRNLGYVDILKDNFKLILFDARGHGLSDKPHEVSEYGVKMADDVIAVLDNLGIAKAHYFGYSLGATTGFTLANRKANRFYSFILGGMGPYNFPEVMVQAIKVSINGFKLLRDDPQEYILWMEELLGRSLVPAEKNELLNRDAEVLIAINAALLDTPPISSSDLASISLPCLVFCGDLDPFHSGAKVSADYMLQARFLSLPRLNHIAAFANVNQVLPHIQEFLSDVIEVLDY
ncbi:alpha/beta fold hydrolase [Chloroflexota bacterium]